MHISVAGTTRTLILKMDDSFMTDFSNGLSDHHFTVWIDEDGRSIRPENCYSHYLDNALSVLHAEFRDDAQTSYDSTPSQMGAGSKRRAGLIQLEQLVQTNGYRSKLPGCLICITVTKASFEGQGGVYPGWYRENPRGVWERT